MRLRKLSGWFLVLAVVVSGAAAMADNFGTGLNVFTIDFVPISGATNPTSGIPAGDGFSFTGVTNDHRMGKFEITNDQWDKFKANLAPVPVTGNPLTAYDTAPSYAGLNVPTNNVSWYEAAQFVNWLNTSTGHQAGYNFIGTQGTSDYTLTTWSPAEAAGGTNLYRHKDAFYYLPTENEWMKAAYWNGTALQDYATKAGESLTQGNGTSGSGWNYYTTTTHYATNPPGPWNVGCGSEELNGTHDMMGNVGEWMESSFGGTYDASSSRGLRGGYWGNSYGALLSWTRDNVIPLHEAIGLGFRVASVPEPGSMILLVSRAIVALILWRRCK